MALDIHVMPLWKFWAGEYTTAAERFAEQNGVPLIVAAFVVLFPSDRTAIRYSDPRIPDCPGMFHVQPAPAWAGCTAPVQRFPTLAPQVNGSSSDAC